MLEAGSKVKRLIRGDAPQTRDQGTCTDLYGLSKRVEVVKEQVATEKMVRAVQTVCKEVKEIETQYPRIETYQNESQTDTVKKEFND